MTYIQNKFRNLCLVTTLLLGLLEISPSAFAQGREAIAHGRQANQTLGSASDVWRVELRDLERFLAMSSGDNDGISELHKLQISLKADGQYDSVAETNPFFTVNDGPRTTRNIIGVRTGDRLELGRLSDRVRDNYNLWVHVKERPGGEFPTTLNFQIEVKARELDCSSDNICGRSDTGVITYHVNLDLPSVKSSSCIPANSYRIRAVNGATMTLRPMEANSGRNVRGVRHVNTGSSTGLKIASGTTGPHMAMQSGEICIATTTRPATYIKNDAAGSCLSLPFGHVPNIADVSVPACWINQNTDRDRKAQWRITRKTDQHWSVKNTASNHCLNAKSSQAGPNGGPVKAVGCSAHNDQSWLKIGQNGYRRYLLKNVSTERCLTDENGRAMERVCNGSTDQVWSSIDEY